MVALVRPEVVVALHEAYWGGHACDPPLPAWDRLFEVLSAYAAKNQLTFRSGKRVPRMLREAGLVDIQVRPLIYIHPARTPAANSYPVFVENLRERLIAERVIDKNSSTTVCRSYADISTTRTPWSYRTLSFRCGDEGPNNRTPIPDRRRDTWGGSDGHSLPSGLRRHPAARPFHPDPHSLPNTFFSHASANPLAFSSSVHAMAGQRASTRHSPPKHSSPPSPERVSFAVSTGSSPCAGGPTNRGWSASCWR